MDVTEAVSKAKASIRDLFNEQIASDPLLEEVVMAGGRGTWRITVSFLRMPEIVRDAGSGTGSTGFNIASMPRRVYKVVDILNSGGKVISVRDRELVQ